MKKSIWLTFLLCKESVAFYLTKRFPELCDTSINSFVLSYLINVYHIHLINFVIVAIYLCLLCFFWLIVCSFSVNFNLTVVFSFFRLSFALWLLHLLIMCLAPQYYSRTLICLGFCISLADVVYVLSCPNNLYIPFSDVQGANQLLTFELGWCFWATVTAGTVCYTLLFFFLCH